MPGASRDRPAGREPLAAPGALWESGGRADLAPAPLGASGLVPVRPRGSLSAAEGGSGVGKGALGRVEAKGLRVRVPAAGALAGGRSPQRGAGREEPRGRPGGRPGAESEAVGGDSGRSA